MKRMMGAEGKGVKGPKEGDSGQAVNLSASSSFHPLSSYPFSSLRVLLWDIDGTLVRSAREGAFKGYIAPVFEAIFGTSGRLAEMSVSGMTDLQIAIEALRDAGITEEQVRERAREIQEEYMNGMRRVAEAEELFHALP